MIHRIYNKLKFFYSRQTWWLFFFILFLSKSLYSEEVPHRQLSTKYFKGPVGLNNPLGAFIPQAGNLQRALELSKIVSEEAKKQGIDPRSAPPGFWKDIIKDLAQNQHGKDLLSTLPQVVKNISNRHIQPRFSEKIGILNSLNKTLKDSPFKRSIEDFAFRIFIREQIQKLKNKQVKIGSGNPSTISEHLHQFKNFLEKSGVKEKNIDRLKSLFNHTKNGGIKLFKWLEDFSVVSHSKDIRIPGLPLSVFIAFSALLIAALLFFMRQKKSPKSPVPPLPDFKHIQNNSKDFSSSLLLFYRRLFFEAGRTFQGRTIKDLQREIKKSFPEIKSMTEELNSAFYELWYAGKSRSGEELQKLINILEGCIRATIKPAKPPMEKR